MTQLAGDPRISIHAPIKDATRDNKITMREIRISIHAPIKDATLDLPLLCDSPLTISIHAPIKDATQHVCSSETMVQNFNSRTHKGCDSSGSLTSLAIMVFQFTHP